jgi:hypothetical protein
VDIRIERYRPELAEAWHELLVRAKNSLFLFERPYMDYHGDRFNDASLMAFSGSTPMAVFPAALDADGVLISHPGLTFGGIVFDRNIRSVDALTVLEALLSHGRSMGAQRCLIKHLPEQFATYPSAEIAYGLWRRGFKLVRRDLSSLLPLFDAIPFNSSKAQGVKKAANSGVAIEAASAAEFHELLDGVLQDRHGVSAVHSVDELALLQARFPDKIACHVAMKAGQKLAGALVFRYGPVWHTQYLASSEEGRRVAALDLVLAHVIEQARLAGAKFVSFGASTTSGGHQLNEGLLWQKESFGARAIVHDFYEGEL